MLIGLVVRMNTTAIYSMRTASIYMATFCNVNILHKNNIAKYDRMKYHENVVLHAFLK